NEHNNPHNPYTHGQKVKKPNPELIRRVTIADMRTVACLLALAACGSSNPTTGDGPPGGGDGKPNGDGQSTGDAPPASTPLDQRITTSTISAPGGVKAGDGNDRIWGFGSLRIAPVYTVPFADCGTLVGYSGRTATCAAL